MKPRAVQPGGKPLRKLHLVAARGDVVIVHGEADVVDSAIPERLYDYLPL